MAELTELCLLAQKYGTDKCPQIKHSYTPFYYEMFKDRKETVKKVLEFGVGFCRNGEDFGDQAWDRQLKRLYYRGASLRMWRDFFPNAWVHGADVQEVAMFSDDRITTHLCDERDQNAVTELIKKIGSGIDLFVDDGSHISRNQIHLCQYAMPLLDKDVVYVIEDVDKGNVDRVTSFLGEYNWYVRELPGSKLGVDSIVVVVSHK